VNKKPSLFEQSPKACPTACAMASASKHELTLLFGSRDLPTELEWGRPYVDGPGFKAFTACIGDDHESSGRTPECLKAAHAACIETCVAEETARITRKGERHQGRDEARRKAREKKAVKPKAPSP